MTSKDRIRNALSFKPVDRTPRDLGGMRSTGISGFAYGSLIESLGLPVRKPRLHDTCQMLALPDTDVLDALGCDVVYLDYEGRTNGLEQPEIWNSYNFNGRLEALVPDPSLFQVEKGSVISQKYGEKDLRMIPGSTVFDESHGGQPVDFSAEIRPVDTAALEAELEKSLPSVEEVEMFAELAARVRGNTDRAVFFSGINAGFRFRGGMANWSMLCLLNPENVHDVHRLEADYTVERYRRILPAVRESVDILLVNADDYGTQNACILPPEVFQELYVPYYKQVNAEADRLAPEVFRFLHSCGAIYDILDDLIDSGIQVINPVQWTAGGRTFSEWKEKCRNRAVLWGGGVDTQSVLPFGTFAEITSQVKAISLVLKEDSGFIFNPIHNILAEIPGDKIKLLYDSVA